MNIRQKIVIVMPAYNAARTLRDTYREIPKKLRGNVILVDDASEDDTVLLAKRLKIKVFRLDKNIGYGGNQKTCYKQALKFKPDVVVMLHPDYQYDAGLIEELTRPIFANRFDFMFGSRVQNKKSALSGGMPKIKYYVNRVVCLLENILLEVNLTEHFSGFRAYSRRLLEKIPFEFFSNDFVFDQQMTISALSYNFRIGEIPITTRYHDKASSIRFFKGTKFILETFIFILLYKLHQKGIIKSKLYAKLK